MRDSVEIVEVSPRDGLQNESVILDTAGKLALIERAVRCGVRRLEATSFVNPKRVPQMADADAVAAGLGAFTDLIFQGLALNERGFRRVRDAGLQEVNFAVAASDTFSRRNQGTSRDDSIAVFSRVMRDSRSVERANLPVSVTISTAFGCPFEGDITLVQLMQVVEACASEQPREIALADTIGVASPRDVSERIAAVRVAFPAMPIRLHLHNTRNTGLANAWAGLEAGVSTLDTSFGGVGGCPFAPRATGNIPTEDVVYMLERGGVHTGLDLDACIDAALWLEQQLGKTLPGMVMKAGRFPPRNH